MIVNTTAEGVTCAAPAKLNLFLEVLDKRPDGYHELETLMVTIDLSDRLDCRDEPSGSIVLLCDDPRVPLGADNLAVRAAERLRQAAGAPSLGARIALRKEIPMQAGLGGGSSDAAAALVSLDRLWNLQTSPGQLEALAGTLGSDVPFFLHAPAAVCRGRGERVEPVIGITTTTAFWFVLVCPAFGLSTASVYAQVRPPARPRSIGPVLEALTRGDLVEVGRNLFNRLEPAAADLQPALGPIRDTFERLRPALTGHLMSGSGSACFGLARDHDAARWAADQLTHRLGPGLVRVVRANLESSPA